MNYWIIVDDRQLGPLSEVELRNLTPAPTTPVWRDGLTDWIALAELPEYEEIMGQATETVAVPPPVPEPATSPQAPHPWDSPRQPEVPCHAATASEKPDASDNGPAPTYLGWSVAATLLCCTILGIVAIVYSVKVRNANDRCDYAEAWRCHRALELWLIAAIVLGLVSTPFSMMFQMMAL